MGWIHDVPEDDLYDHEGYCVAVLGDGTEPAPLQFPVPHREGITTRNSAWWLYDGDKGRPRAVAVRAACACGWRSRDMFPIDFQDHDATDGWDSNSGPFAAWNQQHIGSLLGDTVPADVTGAVTTARNALSRLADTRPLAALTALGHLAAYTEQQTIQAAVAAKTAGRSWAEIGGALGSTRQGAFGRFSRHMPPGIVD